MSVGDNNTSIYIYNGADDVPEDVTHVKVDPSVTVIPEGAFEDRLSLEEVELPEGLIRIEKNAFTCCESLKRINIPTTIEEIGESAFESCRSLEHIILPEGLQRLGVYAFSYCKSLKQINNIPPGITTIEQAALFDCRRLTDISFSEGLREIGEDAISRCKSLVSVTLPSSLNVIGDEAFEGCERLNEVNIPETIESIEARAFKNCNFTNFRFPPSLGNDVDISIVGDNRRLVSIELPETIEQLVDYHDADEYGTDHLCALRNIALPSECVMDTDSLYYCSDLGLAFGVDTEYDDYDDNYTTISDALKQRFDDLPIHKICYYQSYYDNETTMLNLIREINPWTSKPPGQLNRTGKQQDCLGMTPLHILACSTKQNVEMIYRLLIDKYPETLIMKDEWGDIPLLYTFWCNAPAEIVDLLVESYKTFHPDYEFDWFGMIQTSTKRNIPHAIIQKLVSTHQKSFSDQYLDMQQVVTELAAFDTKKAKYNCGRGQCTPIETFRYLLRTSITKRLDSLDIRRWCTELENCIKSLSDSLEAIKIRDSDTQAVYDRLATYESIKEGTSVLELAMWKAKIDTNPNKRPRVDGKVDYRGHCRVNCGADILIRNVLPYLIPK